VGPVSPFHPQLRRRRSTIAAFGIMLLIACLGSAYFRAQVLQGSSFKLRADDNRLRMIPVPAPRGAILDRNGELIAETVVAYGLELDPAPPEEMRRQLEFLAPALDLDSIAIAELLERLKEQPKEPLAVRPSLDFSQVSWLEEHRLDIPGMRLESHPVRRYPAGSAVAHLVGYVGEISADELKQPRWQGYRSGQQIGKAGLERQYESVLGGKAGARYREVDARGRVVGEVAEDQMTPAVPGATLRLSLDLDLQRFAQKSFPARMRGAVVAMVPSTGEVLALYSNPSYDPNLLAGRIDSKVWRELNGDAARPLLNRATAGAYPPGSTWKLATALIALEKGVITPEARLPIPCTGGMSYAGRYSRCMKREGHGFLELATAIEKSCNVYFYQLGIRLGLNTLAREGTRLGFGRKTGIDLPTEIASTFPSGSDWYRKRFGWTPTPSEVMSLSIGQGPNAQTPLRMAQFFSALAGNGTAPAPQLVAHSGAAAAPETDLKVSAATLAAARVGLARVLEPGGTAYRASLKNWKMYGKTGTSQNSRGGDHAWFTGFAGPMNGEPEVVVAVILEHGLHGSEAAQLAAKVADFYLNKTHGLKTETLQTLGERSAGVPFGSPAPPRRPAAPAPRPAEPAVVDAGDGE
jgi:penicillin-binding protein 2